MRPSFEQRRFASFLVCLRVATPFCARCVHPAVCCSCVHCVSLRLALRARTPQARTHR